MATHYGELIDSDESFTYTPIFQFFVKYFNNPTLALFKEDENGYVIYGAKVKSLLSRQKKYLFVLLKKNKIVTFSKQTSLNALHWDCIQTRLLDEDYPLPTFSYAPFEDGTLISVHKKEQDKHFIYYTKDSKFPIQIVLLISKNQMKPYSDQGTLHLAIDTFSCLIYRM